MKNLRLTAILIALITFLFLLSACSNYNEATEIVDQLQDDSTKTGQCVTDISLKVTVYDDTELNEPDPEIWIEGAGSWYPNLALGRDSLVPSAAFSAVNNKIYIYPDGRQGNEIVLEIILTNEMSPTSDMDTIHIEIHDKVVKARGTPVGGTTKEFKR